MGSSPRFAFFYHHYGARYHILLGDFPRALADAETAGKIAAEMGIWFYEALAVFDKAQALHKAGERRRAFEQLHLLDQLVLRVRSHILEFMYLMARAQFALDAGDEASGLDFLEKALALGRKQAYVAMFAWWQPAVMADLCTRALNAGIETEYVQSLILKRHLFPEEPPVDIDAWPWPVRIHTLGRFELLRDGKLPSVCYGRSRRNPCSFSRP